MTRARLTLGTEGTRQRCVALSRTAMWAIVLLTGATTGADLRLIDAVRTRNRDAVGAVLKTNVDVNARQADGATALHWAAFADDVAMVDLLMAAGADVNAANDHGVTPVTLACANANAPMIEKFLAAGANPNATQLSGETAVMTASRTGSAAGVRALVRRGADVNARERSRGQTALMWAVAQRHGDVVRALLESHADVHARSSVRPMRARTSDSILNDWDGVIDIAQGGFTPLLFAARQGAIVAARLLLDAGANVNDAAPDGTSVLVVAVHSDQSAVATLLLERGADPNAIGSGYTALHAAVLRGNLPIVRALLEHRANPDVPFTQGTHVRRFGHDYGLSVTVLGATPYLLAAQYAEPDFMRLLVAGGADPKATLKDGTTAAMMASGIKWTRSGDSDRRSRDVRLEMAAQDAKEVEARTLEAVTAALDLGGSVDAVNEAGDTALHAAVTRGFNTVVQLLVDRGASLRAKNTNGLTPLAVAMRRRPGVQGVRFSSPASTIALLRKLGAEN